MISIIGIVSQLVLIYRGATWVNMFGRRLFVICINDVFQILISMSGDMKDFL